MKDIKKILIANRGEIALRIIWAARELGIKTVAVYSEDDRYAKHVKYADEAYFLGESIPAKSYLNVEKILSIAEKAGCDAIHPGYGFLAENADFAESVIERDILWIGPDPEVMRISGDKIRAREMAQRAGAPLVPGATIQNLSEIKQIAAQVGFPLLIKAAAGGGGKGIHIVNKEEELESAVRMSMSEAKSAFGDDTIYIEKLLQAPKHIEIQVLLDKYGNGVYFPERECSVQRRYQKIMEETPSATISRDMAEELGKTALNIAKEIKYHTAGTVEFLVDGDKFYFLEINARIQVEHPITEAITGIDLVENQIRLAAGEKLSLKQDDIKPRGHAIEARIYAEDPYNKFVPSPGKIEYWKEPSMPGIRCDSSLDDDISVSVYYDPILSKLISYAENRQKAIIKLYNALSEYHIAPNRTSIPLLRAVLENEDFLAGNYDTKFIDKNSETLFDKHNDREEILDAIAVYFVASKEAKIMYTSDNKQGEKKITSCWDSLVNWRG